MFKHAKHTFTVSITPKLYSFLVEMGGKYGFKSKSTAIEWCIQKAIAHERLIEVSEHETIRKKIEEEAEKQARDLYQAKRIKEMEEKKNENEIKTKQDKKTSA